MSSHLHPAAPCEIKSSKYEGIGVGWDVINFIYILIIQLLCTSVHFRVSMDVKYVLNAVVMVLKVGQGDNSI